MSAASPVSSATVTITFARGRLSVEPEKVEIPVGGVVVWYARSVFDQGILVDIVFHGSPFTHTRFRQQIKPMQISQIESSPAQEPGEYKYDVKITTFAGEYLADDDPYVIVTGEW